VLRDPQRAHPVPASAGYDPRSTHRRREQHTGKGIDREPEDDFSSLRLPAGQVVTVIIFIAVGIGLLALIAIAVGIIDAAQAPKRRMVAAERRARWEATRQPEYYGGIDDSWDDD
jgi:hypothetical protein